MTDIKKTKEELPLLVDPILFRMPSPLDPHHSRYNNLNARKATMGLTEGEKGERACAAWAIYCGCCSRFNGYKVLFTDHKSNSLGEYAGEIIKMATEERFLIIKNHNGEAWVPYREPGDIFIDVSEGKDSLTFTLAPFYSE